MSKPVLPKRIDDKPTVQKVVFDQPTPLERGLAHGEMWREPIAELAQIRTELALKQGPCQTLEQLQTIANLHLEPLRQASEEMYLELSGIAKAANATLTDIVILNQYTDLRDISPSILGDDKGPTNPNPQSYDPGGCTALYVNGNHGQILGQTWDMHGNAEPYVRVIQIQPPDSEHETLCFTLTGCLGMTGLHSTGLGITINNLTSTDAGIGLIWPAMVRMLLDTGSAHAAKQLLFGTQLSSGRNFMIVDHEAFYGIEISGQQKIVTQTGHKMPHIHTNHCFDPKLRQVEKISPQSTTFRRMEIASTSYIQTRPSSLEEVCAFLSSHEGYPTSLCTHPVPDDNDPAASRTCGLMAMDLQNGVVRYTRGCPHESAYEQARLTRGHYLHR